MPGDGSARQQVPPSGGLPLVVITPVSRIALIAEAGQKAAGRRRPELEFNQPRIPEMIPTSA